MISIYNIKISFNSKKYHARLTNTVLTFSLIVPLFLTTLLDRHDILTTSEVHLFQEQSDFFLEAMQTPNLSCTFNVIQFVANEATELRSDVASAAELNAAQCRQKLSDSV